jgi:hypothetical protein
MARKKAAAAPEARGLSPGMAADEMRRQGQALIDDAMGHSWLVRGDNRKLLSALRTYLPQMPDAELQRLISCIPA